MGLKEYQDLVSQGARCPLYKLVKDWVCAEYDVPVAYEINADTPMAPESRSNT